MDQRLSEETKSSSSGETRIVWNPKVDYRLLQCD